ncbi:proline-rich p65 protein [Lasius niger]|uniref:Proline-rich p65 protein n=1 Tax=Lasius niger TaxID=67767 RepID=A0A0J7KXQ8_LASNI|nr:proline-rich p65 protein [Lasius niger]
MKSYLSFAKEVIRALVEKLETSGDVPHLRARNQELAEELKEANKREERMRREIDDLHSAIHELRKEVRALKDGNVFSENRLKDPRPAARKGKAVDLTDDMVESRLGNTPGCSADQEYMNRGMDWCTDSGVSWTAPAGPVPETVTFSGKEGTVHHAPSKHAEVNRAVGDGVRRKAGPLLRRPSGPRRDIGIVGNVRIAPPNTRPKKKSTTSNPMDDSPANHRGGGGEGGEWNTVGRGGRSASGGPARSSNNNNIASPRTILGTPENNKNKAARRMSGGATVPTRRWIPKPAVVTITSNNNEEFSYAKILSTARTKVSLKDIGIKQTKIRKAINGGLVIEIPGPDGASLANTLQEKLKTALDGMAKVNKPVALSELRLTGIDPSTSVGEISRVLALAAKCSTDDLKMSNINMMRDGMGVIWVRCPSAIAYVLASVGRLNLGWTSVRVDLLKKKPIQCFRCWHYGHVRSACRSTVDRSGLCFRCSSDGHRSGSCTASLCCALCASSGRPTSHRLLSADCPFANGSPDMGVGVPARRAVASSHDDY